MNRKYENLSVLRENIMRRAELEKSIKDSDAEIRRRRDAIAYFEEESIKLDKEASKINRGIFKLTDIKGKRADEKKREACRYGEKCDRLRKEISEIRKNIEQLKEEWISLPDCADEYKELISEKLDEMQKNNHMYLDEIMKLKKTYGLLENYKEKLCETYEFGQYLSSYVEDITWNLHSLKFTRFYDAVTFKKDEDNGVVRKNNEIGDLDNMITDFKKKIKEIKNIRKNDINFAGFGNVENDFRIFDLPHITVVSGIGKLRKELRDVEVWADNLCEYLYFMMAEADKNMKLYIDKCDEIIINAEV